MPRADDEVVRARAGGSLRRLVLEPELVVAHDQVAEVRGVHRRSGAAANVDVGTRDEEVGTLQTVDDAIVHADELQSLRQIEDLVLKLTNSELERVHFGQ